VQVFLLISTRNIVVVVSCEIFPMILAPLKERCVVKMRRAPSIKKKMINYISGFLQMISRFSRFYWYTQTQTCATWGHTSTYIQIQITKWVSRQAKEHNTNIEIRITYSVCSQKQLYYLTVLDYSDNMPPILVSCEIFPMILAPLKERCVVKMRYMKRGEVFVVIMCIILMVSLFSIYINVILVFSDLLLTYLDLLIACSFTSASLLVP
jgi:hypothetical protein